MPHKLPIETLTDLARKRTEEAARKLASLQKANLSADMKLQVLQQYRHDYSTQLSEWLEGGISPAMWRNYQSFLTALDAGIEQQRLALRQAQERLQNGRGHWQQQQRRLSAFETLGERIQRQQNLIQGRRDQRSSDDIAARLTAARPRIA